MAGFSIRMVAGFSLDINKGRFSQAIYPEKALKYRDS